MEQTTWGFHNIEKFPLLCLIRVIIRNNYVDASREQV